MIELHQTTAELDDLLKGQKDWTEALRTQVAGFLWRYASDRMLRNLADLMDHPEVAPRRIVASAQEVRPLVGIIPITDFLKLWRQAVEQEQADLRYIAWRDEQERQRRTGSHS